MPSLKNMLYETPMVPPKQIQFTPALESLFQDWAKQNQVPQSNDYDMRGFFMGLLSGDPAATQGINPADNQMHYSDKWKLPNHPKFSSESLYSKSLADPRWVENPAPYAPGTWGLLGRKGLKAVEIPE